MEVSSQMTYEEFKPPLIEWAQEPGSHILRVDLPGFKAEDLKVQVDNSGKLTIRGRKKVGDTKYSRLKLVFDTPMDANIDKIFGQFDEDCLTLVMPKKDGKELALPPSSNAALGAIRAREAQSKRDEHAPHGDIVISNYIGESLMDKVMACPFMDYFKEKMSERKDVIAVAAVAFSIGFFISRRMKST